MNWQVIYGSMPEYIEGLKVSIILLLISVSTGFVLSLPLAIARVSQRSWLRTPVWLFTYVIRGTPLLIQLYLIYQGLAQFEWVRDSAAWVLLKNAWFCAWLAFTINTTAYTTEIIAGALRATPVGEIEAARCYGLSGFNLYRRILIPSALRRALPQYSNEVVSMLHATSIVGAVTLVDITRVSRDVYYNHLLTIEAFGTSALIYFTLTFALVGGFRLLERRFLRHLHRDTTSGGPAAAPRASTA
jgi:arginine/ornithine transport system permease protein